MKSRSTLVLLAIFLAGAIGWYFNRAKPDAVKPDAVKPDAVVAQTPAPAAGSVARPAAPAGRIGPAAPDPGAPGMVAAAPSRPPSMAPPRQSIAVRTSVIADRYETSTDKRALFDELKASESAEAKYFAAKILRDCLDVGQSSLAEVQAKFVATVPAGAPNAATRLEAFRQLKEPCAGFSGRKINPGEIDQLIAEGAQKGDPRALARQLQSGQIDTANDPVGTVARLLDSGDPYVFEHVVAFLQLRHKGDMFIDGKPVDPAERGAVNFAWSFVSCDYGRACGAQNDTVLNACANEGLCNAASLEELISTSFAALDVYQRSLAYREKILTALRNRDYAALGVLLPGK